MATSMTKHLAGRWNIDVLYSLANNRCRPWPSKAKFNGTSLLNDSCIKRNTHDVSKPPPFKDTSNTLTNQKVSEHNENDDFFGIPADYKLEHARFDLSSKPTSTKIVHKSSDFTNGAQPPNSESEKDFTLEKYNDINVQSRSKRRQKRNLQSMFPTSFGVISFDKSTVGKTSENNATLSLKAREILKTSGKDTLVTQRSDSGSIDSVTESKEANWIEEQYFPPKPEEVTESLKSCRPYNFVDEQYFGISSEGASSYHAKDLGEISQSRLTQTNAHSELKSDEKNDAGNFFKEQYFGALSSDNIQENEKNSNTSSKSFAKPSPSNTSDNDFNEIDAQFFGDAAKLSQAMSPHDSNLENVAINYMDSGLNPPKSDEFVHKVSNFHKSSSKELNLESDSRHVDYRETTETQSSNHTVLSHRSNITTDRTVAESDVVTNDSFLNRQEKQKKTVASKLNSAESDSSSALSFALNYRESLSRQNADNAEEQAELKIPTVHNNNAKSVLPEGEELVSRRHRFDSKGFRILDGQIPRWDKMTSADVVHLLKSRIIFNHDEFMAIDKPYGLPSFGQQSDRLSVSTLLPTLVSTLPHSFNTEELHIVQGLDRDVTGTLLLAKNPDVAATLKSMLNDSNRSILKFWAITKGVPKPSEGTVDIPIGDARVAGIYKRILRPLYKPTPQAGVKLSKAPSEAATTQYKVLSRSRNAALVECVPLSALCKHQLRVHLASGLATPILGDHTYSHFSRLAPQKLDPDTLGLLKIRQAKARHLPLHLHLRSVVLHDYRGRMVHLTSRLSEHCVDSLRSLKLQLPRR